MSSTPLHTDSRQLVLASTSETRSHMLRAAGLSFEQKPAPVDEQHMMASLEAEGLGAREATIAIAELKARRASDLHAGAFCIGGDQTLSVEGKVYAKAESLEEAKQHLLELRGQRHSLHSAAAVAVDGKVIWRHADTAQMWMRNFTDEFLDAYLKTARDVTGAVGCYRLEEEGVHLFDRVAGDWFTIMGLPLVPLLAFLREHGIAPR